VRGIDPVAGGGYIETEGESSTKGVNDGGFLTSGRAGAAGRPQADGADRRAAHRPAVV